MKKINSTLIYLIGLISFCYAIKDINSGIYDRLTASLSIIFVLLIPRILSKIFKLNITQLMEFIYVIFIILAQFLGSVINLYDTIWSYDLLVHFLSGILTSFFSLAILSWLKVYNKKSKLFNAVFMICFTLAAACTWEFLEFAVFNILGVDMQNHLTTGVFDTMYDMLVATLGGLIILVVYLINNKTLEKVVSNKN